MSEIPKLIPIKDDGIIFNPDMDTGLSLIAGGMSHLIVNGMDVTQLEKRVEELEKNVENLLEIIEKILDKTDNT